MLYKKKIHLFLDLVLIYHCEKLEVIIRYSKSLYFGSLQQFDIMKFAMKVYSALKFPYDYI